MATARKIPEPQAPQVPSHWRKGELLDVKHFTDGSFTVGRYFEYAQNAETLKFTNSIDCQNFVSAWYAREQGR